MGSKNFENQNHRITALIERIRKTLEGETVETVIAVLTHSLSSTLKFCKDDVKVPDGDLGFIVNTVLDSMLKATEIGLPIELAAVLGEMPNEDASEEK